MRCREREPITTQNRQNHERSLFSSPHSTLINPLPHPGPFSPGPGLVLKCPFRVSHGRDLGLWAMQFRVLLHHTGGEGTGGVGLGQVSTNSRSSSGALSQLSSCYRRARSARRRPSSRRTRRPVPTPGCEGSRWCPSRSRINRASELNSTTELAAHPKGERPLTFQDPHSH